MSIYRKLVVTVIIRILHKLKKKLGCNLTLDWIHHKFLKLNFLRIRITICENAKACCCKLGKSMAVFFLEFCAELQYLET